MKKVVLHCGVVFCTKCEKLTDPQNKKVHFSGSFQKCLYDFLRARLEKILLNKYQAYSVTIVKMNDYGISLMRYAEEKRP